MISDDLQRPCRHAIVPLLALVVAIASPLRAQVPVTLEDGDRVMVVGNTFAERMAMSGYLDALCKAAHPDADITLRSIPWSADEVGLRPREMNVPTTEDHVDKFDPDVVLMFYAMSESFAGEDGLNEFEGDLQEHVERLRGRLSGEPRRIVLVSPIAHEDLSAPWPTGDAVAAHNASIERYVEVMRRFADDNAIAIVDLYAPTRAGDLDSEPLTINGIHPSERGCAVLAREFGRQLGWLTDAPADPGEAGAAARLRLLACDKFYMERLLYRPTNTEYVWGRRAEPFGVVNFPEEMAQLERMIESRERAMADLHVSPASLFATLPVGQAIWDTLPSPDVSLPEDEWTPTPVEAKGTETSLGDLTIKDPDEFAGSFTIADAYEISCFASEQDFDELANPVALTFDDRGRLWVLCATTYPHLMPGSHPTCHLLILEDTDADGHADKRTVFADHLYIPTGFAIDTDAVYIGQSPDLLRLRDTDGDDVADTREVVLSGFAMPDSHHQISAFEWTPDGAILMHEGVFSNANVETPCGTRRTRDAGVWRYDPRSGRLDVMSHCGFANPWGHAFNDYGQSVLADASGGDNFSFSHVIMPYAYPDKPNRPGPILNRGRPTAGCELIASTHFPDDVQGSFLVNQSIGFHGTRWDRLIEDGSSWRSERMPKDLIDCSDTNFRPVAMEIGPDGTLYIVDWCNPIVGHMQYSVRDPRRDHTHGRIWRVRHAERPLVETPNVHDASTDELFDVLRLPERNTRQLARRRLQSMPDAVAVADRWLAALSPVDPLRDRLMLEVLWIHGARGDVDIGLARRVMGLYEPLARAGAVRQLRHWLQAGEVAPDDAAPLLEAATRDPDMRVRLEGVLACGFLDRADAANIAALAADQPMDDAMSTVLQSTLKFLSPSADVASAMVRRIQLGQMPVEELSAQEIDDVVARVLLARDDAPLQRRHEALVHLAGSDPDAQSRRLVAELREVNSDHDVRAIGGLLLEQGTSLDEVRPDLAALLDADDASTRQVALAALMVAGDANDSVSGAGLDDLVIALSLLPAGKMPDFAGARLRDGVESAGVDPLDASEQIVRHEGATEPVFEWLASHIDAVEGEPLSAWSDASVTAMAAARAMHTADTWPEGFDQYRIEDVSPQRLQRGREIYLDEGVGCARCHGVDGRGLEGFPPLNRSAWLQGNPERAASIVLHGLYGPVTVPGAGAFNSTMAPLGSLLSDEQVADVITFARRSWGNFGAPVSTEAVASARAEVPKGGIWETGAMAERFPLSRDALYSTVRTAGATDQSPARTGGGITVGMIAGLAGGIVAIVVAMTIVLAKVARHTTA
jgi:mono/diheme cytochrome c family protein